jgi:hypothetical protein
MNRIQACAAALRIAREGYTQYVKRSDGCSGAYIRSDWFEPETTVYTYSYRGGNVIQTFYDPSNLWENL